MAVVPHFVLAAGWVPFAVALTIILIFSFLYIRYFQSKYDSELSSTIACILGLEVALLTIALIPVDIFLVSYMKNSDGTFKDWANSSAARDHIEHAVLYGYYALYAFVVLFVFFVLPFFYFFYEEGDEDTTIKSRICTGLKFTSVFVLVAGILLLIGAFVPVKSLPNTNSTEWVKIKDLFDNLADNDGQDAISFTISVLTVLGMFAAVVYVGYGMSAWPMDLVKGRRSATKERMEVMGHKEDIQAEINNIRIMNPERHRLSRTEQRHLDDLEEQLQCLERRESHLEATENSLIAKCAVLCRPFQVVFGVMGFLITMLVFLSLLLTNIDKILHSLGWRMGFALTQRHLPNPIDITLVLAQQVFPVDYVLFAAIVTYIFLCAMGGLQHMGIWCCCMRMYKIRPHRTKPQGLLFLCFLLMFIVLALNIIVYQLTPQYSTYGSQHYVQYHNVTSGNSTHLVGKLVPCSTEAPSGECIMTQMSTLLTRFFYKAWYFGATYFCLSWALLGNMLLSFVVTLVKKRRSPVEGSVDREDLIESDDDDDLLRA